MAFWQFVKDYQVLISSAAAIGRLFILYGITIELQHEKVLLILFGLLIKTH